MTTFVILVTLFVIVSTIYVITQSRRIKELEGQVQSTNSLLTLTKDILWERIIPNQQFPYQDMEAMLTRLNVETNGGVKVLLRQKLTGKA